MDDPFKDLPEQPPGELLPEEAASEGALAVAESFFNALKSGDGRALWDLFSENARNYIINIGQERGMEFELASRLRAGTASDEELDDFLADLVAGIQRDLAGLDFARLALESKVEPEAPMMVRVTFLQSLGPMIDELQTAIPAGALVLSLEDSQWRLERIVPRPGQERSQGAAGS